MADRANAYYNSFDEAASVIEGYAEDLRSDIEFTIQRDYNAVAPFVLSALIANKITRKTGVMTKAFQKAYMAMTMAARRTATRKAETLTKAERARLYSKMQPIVDNIKLNSKQLKNATKAMLVQNVSGGISFNQMVKGLKTLYPSFESKVYTEANTALQRNFKTTNFETAVNAGIEYYRYDGPLDDRTRPYCRDHVGKVYTATQAEKIQAEIMTFYNCRHQLNPISEEEYLANK